jgi:hypothetical protein
MRMNNDNYKKMIFFIGNLQNMQCNPLSSTVFDTIKFLFIICETSFIINFDCC